jgi:glycosyltransferase involved in cell wall biosynthesis
MFVQKKMAYSAIEKHLEIDTNVALIDYASSAILVREYLELKKIPYIVHVHGYDITSAIADPQYKKELNSVLNGAIFFIAASNYMKRLLVLLGADEAKIIVVRYGIDVDQMIPIEWETRLKSPPSLIFLGRLTPKKHPIALLHAFKQVLDAVPNARDRFTCDEPLTNPAGMLVIKFQSAEPEPAIMVFNFTATEELNVLYVELDG